MKDTILIVDFGSQVTKLIARRIREFGVFSQIVPYHQLKKKNIQVDEVKGIIFSGGPNSVDEKFAPKVPKSIYNLNIPILGICYGLQLICKKFGGKVSYSQKREFGKIFFISGKRASLTYLSNSKFKNTASSFTTGLVSHLTRHLSEITLCAIPPNTPPTERVE